MTERPITIVEWKPLYKGRLRGWATVKIERMHLQVADVGVYEKKEDGTRWAKLPSKPMIGRDGVVLRDKEKRVRYQVMMEWTDKEVTARFSAAVVAALLERFPTAFDPS